MIGFDTAGVDDVARAALVILVARARCSACISGRDAKDSCGADDRNVSRSSGAATVFNAAPGAAARALATNRFAPAAAIDRTSDAGERKENDSRA